MSTDLSGERLRRVLDNLRAPTFYVGLNVDGERTVRAGEAELRPGPSQLVWNHSPDGFSWGYGGSGPAQLALALLFDTGLPPDLCVQIHQDLKWAKVAKWSQSACWTLPGAELLRWIAAALAELVASERDQAEGGTDGT